MKIKRYFASDIRQAIRMVREEQGPDAVILSNRRVEGGVEIVAALDYDETVVRRIASAGPVTAAAAPKDASETADAPFTPPAENPAVAAESPVVQVAQRNAEPAAFVARRQQPEEELDAVLDFAMPSRLGLSPGSKEERPSKRRTAQPEIVWSQEPSLVAMRDEIRQLRSLLENQLSGLAWREMKQQHPQRIKVLEKLLQMGLAPDLCNDIANQIRYGQDMAANWRQALGLLASQITVTHDDILTHGGVVALIGPCGVGKTTTIAKLAARYTLRHGAGKIALVTTDSFRIGAHHQLRTYGQILGAPVHLAKDGQALQEIVTSLHDKSLILIDTAGMSQRDLTLSEQFAMLSQQGIDLRTYVVLAASSQRATLDEVLRQFCKVELDGAILTKLDEAAILGEAISALVQYHLPVAYLSDGQAVPEDLHPARSNSLVNRCVTLMQQYSHAPSEEQMAVTFGRMAG